MEQGDGYRLGEHAGDGGAVFCRLEHIVPWAIQGARWNTGDSLQTAGGRPPESSPESSPGSSQESFPRFSPELAPARCAACERQLEEDHLLLVRHRREHRIADRFCSVDHLLEWAKAGGRWRGRPE